MSTLTSVGGMLPLVLFPGAGSELYRGLGSVVVGGLLVSTLFTLVLTPLVMSMVFDLRLVLGGTARVWGAVVGTIVAIGLFDILLQSYIPLPRDWYGQALPVAREAIFGATLVIVLLFRPLGILGDMRRDKLMRKIHGR